MQASQGFTVYHALSDLKAFGVEYLSSLCLDSSGGHSMGEVPNEGVHRSLAPFVAALSRAMLSAECCIERVLWVDGEEVWAIRARFSAWDSLASGLIVDDLGHLGSFWLLDCAARAFAAWLAFAELAQAVISVAIRINATRTGVGRLGSLHFVSHLLLTFLTAGWVAKCALEKFIILTSCVHIRIPTLFLGIEWLAEKLENIVLWQGEGLFILLVLTRVSLLGVG